MPLGRGWAIVADMPPVGLPEDGIEIDFGVRDGKLECVAVRSTDDGPALTATLLRRVGPLIAEVTRTYWSLYVVRIREVNGELIAVLPYGVETPQGTVGADDEVGPDVVEEFATRHRRKPVDDDLLDRIEDLWAEAKARKEPSAAAWVGQKLNYSEGTIRNYRSLRRKRRREEGEHDG